MEIITVTTKELEYKLIFMIRVQYPQYYECWMKYCQYKSIYANQRIILKYLENSLSMTVTLDYDMNSGLYYLTFYKRNMVKKVLISYKKVLESLYNDFSCINLSKDLESWFSKI